jgi:hypothetical protein
MLADSPFSLNLLATEKQLSAKARPCSVDKIRLNALKKIQTGAQKITLAASLFAFI